MTLVTYPAACKPHAQQWTLTQPMQRSRSAWTGREKRLVISGARWSLASEVIPMRLATYQAWASFAAQCEGGLNTFQVYATPATQSGPASATWAMDGSGQVVNYALYSEQFDNAAWSKLNTAAITANSVVAPDGTTTGDTLNFSGNVNAAIQQDTALTAVASTTYTFSVYLYGTAGQTLTIYIGTSSGVGGSSAATVTLTAAFARYSVTVTLGGSPTGTIRVIASRNSGTATTLYAWGAQVEIGAAASTYVATTSAATTSRAAFKVTGLTVSSTNMTAGQMLTIDDRLYTLTADVVADSGGKAVVSVKPNLAALTTSTSIAYVQRPYAVVAMTDTPTVSVEPGPIYRVSFTAEEVF